MQNLRIGYSRSKSIVAWMIRTLTRSEVNHTFFLVEDDGTEMVIGADWNGLVMQTRHKFEKSSTIVEIPNLVENIDDGIPFLLNTLDAPYDYTGILGMPIVLMFRFWLHRKISNPFSSPNSLFCSEAGAKLFKYVKYPGSEELIPNSSDPGYLLNWQKSINVIQSAKK